MMKATTISRSVIARTVVGLLRLAPGRATVPALLALTALFWTALAAPHVYAQATGLIVADFNHDGLPDVLSPSLTGNSLTISFGSVPYGTFNSVAKIVPYPALCANVVANSIVVGDFNGDGYPDIAMSCFGGSLSTTTIFVMLGNGDGTFTVSASMQGLSNTVVGDFNKDGHLDIVTAGPNASSQQTLIFYSGNGDGTFGTGLGSSLVVPSINAMAAVDLNKDGYPDIVIGYFSSSSTNTLSVLGNNTDGTFGVVDPSGGGYAPNTSADVGSYPAVTEQNILVGNFFGNGMTDLAVPDTGTSPGVYVLQNTSSGTTYSLAAAVKTAVTGLSSALAASFVNAGGVGLSDLLVSNGTTISVLANSGSGTFGSTYANLTGASTATLVAAADANGDGHADIFIATIGAGGTTLTTYLVSGSATATSSAFSLPAGAIPVSGVWPGNINFTGSTASGTQMVNLNAPIITWANPAAISYDTPLSGTQLNAVATNALGMPLAGTFTYTPAAGTVLNAGTQTLSVIFTPQDTADYAAATQTVNLVVNAVAPIINWTPAVTTIQYGTALTAAQLDATATFAGNAVAGTFAYTPAAGAVLGGGTQTLSVVFTPTSSNYITQTGSTQITVTKAMPTIVWAMPASINYGTPLSATQLNATATGVGGVTLPGVFAYTPAAGAVLNPGTQSLSVTFTPTDIADYAVATASNTIVIADVTLTSFTPNTATIGDPDKTITITGSGFGSAIFAQLGGGALVTTYVNATTLTAVVPASNFLVAGTLPITLKDPVTGTVTAPLLLTVTAPVPVVTVTVPPTAGAGTQPTVGFSITNPYPVPLTVTFTLTNNPISTPAVDDPAVQFSSGGRTDAFTIPAGSTSVPTIQVQTGTVETNITVTVALTENGIDVTPANIATPTTIAVPAAVPSITAGTLTRNGQTLTVTIAGFSSDREIVQANFHFVAAAGSTISTPDITANVNADFATWFASQQSLQYGSSFHYEQDFNVSDDASHIGSVVVTLTNQLGVSTSQTAQ